MRFQRDEEYKATWTNHLFPPAPLPSSLKEVHYQLNPVYALQPNQWGPPPSKIRNEGAPLISPPA